MKSERINKMVRMAVLSALGIVLAYLVRFPLLVSYLEYDMGNIPILIGSFMYGPVGGLILTFVVSAVQALTFSAQSGWVGFAMHFIATGVLSLVAGTIYRFAHTKKGAVVSLIAASIAVTAVMIPTNLFFTVRYWGTPYDVVVASIWPVIIPFNLIKAGSNSIIVGLIYKPLSRFLRCNLHIGKNKDPKCEL
ncbi:MAG: ECF transporter S component [Eubacteriales bacterium]|nr:ECF transporter S component [Eubacteriales bacterium]